MMEGLGVMASVSTSSTLSVWLVRATTTLCAFDLGPYRSCFVGFLRCLVSWASVLSSHVVNAILNIVWRILASAWLIDLEALKPHVCLSIES